MLARAWASQGPRACATDLSGPGFLRAHMVPGLLGGVQSPMPVLLGASEAPRRGPRGPVHPRAPRTSMHGRGLCA
eukprot:8721894-Pyramimonas_sp.AAC.1